MSNSPFTCPNCGSNEGKIMFDVVVYTDARHFGHFTKADYALKETEVWAAIWDNSWLNCLRCDWQRHPIHERGKYKQKWMQGKQLLKQLYMEYINMVGEDDHIEDMCQEIEAFIDETETNKTIGD